jgi:hypothetical protein
MDNAETLARRFADAQRQTVMWEGLPVYALYELPILAETFSVEFVSAKSHPVQGVRLKVRGGMLRVNEMLADDVLLWRDSAPDLVSIRVQRRGRGTPTLRVWNIWRGGLDVVQAWLGNSGMRVEIGAENSLIQLRCSDGVGQVTFDDLVVRLKLGSASAA